MFIDSLLSAWVQEGGYRKYHRTVSDAAEDIGTSSKELYLYFNARGMDFRSWRTSLRIEDAKRRIIENPDLPLSIIGRKSGFKDRSNFYNTFKSCTGLTPSQWRERNNL